MKRPLSHTNAQGPFRKGTAFMKRKGIIFDLDGVLVHTDEYHYQAWKALADRLGIPFDRTVNNRLRGVSRMESLEIILEKHVGEAFLPEEKTVLAEEKNHIYRQLLNEMNPDSVDPQVPMVLKALRSRGYRLSIGSSSRNTKTILAKTGLTDCFDAISDGTNITRSKPDPEVFFKAAQFLGLAPGDCAVIEDAFSGVDAAKAAGMMAVGIGEAARYEKADCAVTQLQELLDIFT